MTDTQADVVWVTWVAFGTLVNARVCRESWKDLQVVLIHARHGIDERDAREAMWQNGARLLLQLIFLACGIWRLFLPPDQQWWGLVNKMSVSTMAIILASGMLSWSALRDLRLRRQQLEEFAARRAGAIRTRTGDR